MIEAKYVKEIVFLLDYININGADLSYLQDKLFQLRQRQRTQGTPLRGFLLQFVLDGIHPEFSQLHV